MIKLLFLGCNFDQLPYLKIAKQKGYYIVGTDLNNHAPGIKYLDKYYRVGYEDAKGLIDFGKKEKFSYADKVFTASSQFAYIGASAFAKKFGIKFISPKTVDYCLNKIKLYQLFKKQNLQVPEWAIVKRQKELKKYVKKWGVCYLKSDYGKSPHYCYRIAGGHFPVLPLKRDRYFRKYFIIQKEIIGNQFRINWINGQLVCFFKVSDTISVPAHFIDFGDRICKNIRSLIFKLGLQNHLVKFDIIYNKQGCYFIDIGLEPPMRLKLYLEYLGYNFEKIYLEQVVENFYNFPLSDNLPNDLIIKNKIVKKL